MSSRPTIGLSLIVKDVEPIIRECLASAAGVFDQVVVVDTGSIDLTKSVVKTVVPNAQLLDFTPETHPQSFILDEPSTWNAFDWDEEGKTPEIPEPFTARPMLADFGAARQHGWDALTTDYGMWIDSDDVIEGAGNIRGIVDSMERDGIDMAMLAYDYKVDPDGSVHSALARERIARLKSGAKWMHPVHEVLGPWAHERFYSEVKIVHRRWKLGLGYPVNLRNLKILVDWWRRHDVTKDDPRMLFYLARDARAVWPDRTLVWFKEYCRRSGWDAERAQAHMYSGEIYEARDDLENARSEYAMAAVEAPGKPDAFFALANVARKKKDWGKCIEWSEKGLEIERSTAGMVTVLDHNPTARAMSSRVYAEALLELGRYGEAHAVCVAGLAARPDDLELKAIKERAEKTVAESTKREGTTKLYSVPNFLRSALTDPPENIPKPLLTGFALHLWKLHVAAGKHDQALAFLNALPVGLDDTRVGEARELTLANVSKRTLPESMSPFPQAPALISDSDRKLAITIWTGEAWERWRPRSLRTGIGGSEIAAVNMARELVRRGHKLTVISDCEQEESDEGVRYVPYNEVITGRFIPKGDVAVVSRQAYAVLHMDHFAKKILWVHDVHVGTPEPVVLDRYDLIFALSKWHRAFLQETYPTLHPKKIHVTRNGIDLARFKKEPVKTGNRIIYSSSWDRGLVHLLEMMPAIRKLIPDVVLYIYYGSKLWRNLSSDQHEEIDRMDRVIAEGESIGYIVNRGRVGQSELAQAFLASKLWVYPTHFHETSCITAMEAQAAGAVPVTMALAALPETVKYGVLLDGSLTETMKSQFVNEVVRLLETDERREELARRGREYAMENLGWAGVAVEWEELFKNMLMAGTALSVPPPEPELAFPRLAATASSHIEILPRKHRVAVIMGRLSSAVHGIYDIDSIYDEGMMTGTGSSFFNIAHGLAERGHAVDVFCQAKRRYIAAPKLAGANVYNIDEPGLEVDASYDAYISINEPDMLRGVPAAAARICAMWLNDWSYTAPGFDDFVDMYACPSWTHARYIHETTRIAREKLTVINLACNPEFFTAPPSRWLRPHSVAWTSSPDRGLHHLLNFWPEIRERVPDAELRIYYRFKPWFDFMTTDPSQVGNEWSRRAVEIGKKLEELREHGVTLVDSVPPKTMAKELLATRVVAYPCDPTRFTEGFSCSVMDACAAGCVPIISAVDALPEVYGGVAVMIPGPPHEHQGEWVDTVVAGLTDHAYATAVGGAARAFAARHTRQVMAAEWETLIDRLRSR